MIIGGHHGMTYQRLIYLKHQMGMSTYELFQRYPSDIDRVSKVALLDVPDETLKEVVVEEKDLLHLMKLKQRFSKFLSHQHS